MKQNLFCEKRQVREISVDIDTFFSEHTSSTPEIDADIQSLSGVHQNASNQNTDITNPEICQKLKFAKDLYMSPGFKGKIGLVRQNSTPWNETGAGNQDYDKLTPSCNDKRKDALGVTEKSDKMYELQTPENPRRNYQEWENWSYKKMKNEKQSMGLTSGCKSNLYVLGGKQAPMKHLYCKNTKHQSRQQYSTKIGQKANFNKQSEEKHISSYIVSKNINYVQQSSTNSDAEFIAGAELSISLQNSNTMQFQQRNNKIKDISSHFASGPTFQGQAKNLAQFQATAAYAVSSDEKALVNARFIRNQSINKLEPNKEKSSSQQLKVYQLPLGANESQDNSKLEKLRQIEHQKFSKENDRRKIVAYRKRYLNLFSESQNPKKRMHHLIKDFNQKPVSKITKCELPKRKNNFGKKVLVLDNHNINAINLRKTIKAKKALRRYRQKQLISKTTQSQQQITSGLSFQNCYEPNDITSTTNSSVNVVISHIEKFIQRKRQENLVTSQPLTTLPTQVINNNDSSISPRFSFLDVTSLWQDPDTSSKLMTIREAYEEQVKDKKATPIINKLACSLSSSNDWSEGTASEVEIEQQDHHKQQILGEQYLFNPTLLDKSELKQYYKTCKQSAPEIKIQRQHKKEIDIDFCSQSDVKTKIVSQSTAIDSIFKTAESKSRNTEKIEFKIQDLNSKIASDELSMEDQDDILTPIRPSSRPSSIQIRMSSLNQEFEEI